MLHIKKITEEEKLTLENMRKNHPGYMPRMRAHAVLLSQDGYQVNDLSDLFGVCKKTIVAWLRGWANAGIFGLIDKPRKNFYGKSQDVLTISRKQEIKKIQTGLMNGEFELYYQPKVNMRTGTVSGFEALIRWNDPLRGLLQPSDFLPIINNHSVHSEVSSYVMDRALSDLNEWQGQGLDTVVSVNVDELQLNEHDFLDKLKASIANYPSFKAGSLELEILEMNALLDREQVRTIVDNCQVLGVDFALDDFGTGNSSLTYLKQIPVKTLNIDRSFISDIDKESVDLAILEGMVSLASILKRSVIAKGVETVEQGDVLLKIGCELAQGYAIAKPMPITHIFNFINDWKPFESWLNAPSMQLIHSFSA